MLTEISRCFLQSLHNNFGILSFNAGLNEGKCAVREAQQRRFLVDNGYVNIVSAATNYRGKGYAEYQWNCTTWCRVSGPHRVMKGHLIDS
jgi:hypothetical protein